MTFFGRHLWTSFFESTSDCRLFLRANSLESVIKHGGKFYFNFLILALNLKFLPCFCYFFINFIDEMRNYRKLNNYWTYFIFRNRNILLVLICKPPSYFWKVSQNWTSTKINRRKQDRRSWGDGKMHEQMKVAILLISRTPVSCRAQ